MELLIKEIEDRYTRENFKRLQALIGRGTALDGFIHVDIDLAGGLNNHKVYHGLGYAPLDIIQTFKSGTGNLTFNYDKFDKDHLDVSADGPVRVRAFVGSFRKVKK